MTTEEIREAVNAVKGMFTWLTGDANEKYYKTLLSLAEAYLAIKGWPEERILEYVNMERVDNPSYISGEEFNLALHLCKLAAMKEKSRIAEATQKVIDEIKQEIDRRPKYSNLGKIGCLKRVTALLKLINGKEAL